MGTGGDGGGWVPLGADLLGDEAREASYEAEGEGAAAALLREGPACFGRMFELSAAAATRLGVLRSQAVEGATDRATVWGWETRENLYVAESTTWKLLEALYAEQCDAALGEQRTRERGEAWEKLLSARGKGGGRGGGEVSRLGRLALMAIADDALMRLQRVVQWLEWLAREQLRAEGTHETYPQPGEFKLPRPEGEEELLRSCWRLMRAGRPGNMCSVCVDAGCFWRAATLRGAVESIYGKLDAPDHADRPWVRDGLDAEKAARDETELVAAEEDPDFGGFADALWLETCARLALDPSASRYESALYGVIAGLPGPALPVCEDWHSALWVHLRCLLRKEIDAALRAFEDNGEGGMEEDGGAAVGAGAGAGGTPDFNVAPTEEEAFRRLHELPPTDGVRRGCDDRMHSLQRDIVLEDWDSLMLHLLEWIKETYPFGVTIPPGDAAQPLPADEVGLLFADVGTLACPPQLMRFAAHVAMVLRAVLIQRGEHVFAPFAGRVDVVVRDYAWFLASGRAGRALREDARVVATYVREIQWNVKRVACYKDYLLSLPTQRLRISAYRAGQELLPEASDTERAVVGAVDKICANAFASLPDMMRNLLVREREDPRTQASGVSVSDAARLHAFELLTLAPSLQRRSALDRAALLLRSFAVRARSEASRALLALLAEAPLDGMDAEPTLMPPPVFRPGFTVSVVAEGDGGYAIASRNQAMADPAMETVLTGATPLPCARSSEETDHWRLYGEAEARYRRWLEHQDNAMALDDGAADASSAEARDWLGESRRRANDAVLAMLWVACPVAAYAFLKSRGTSLLDPSGGGLHPVEKVAPHMLPNAGTDFLVLDPLPRGDQASKRGPTSVAIDEFVYDEDDVDLLDSEAPVADEAAMRAHLGIASLSLKVWVRRAPTPEELKALEHSIASGCNENLRRELLLDARAQGVADSDFSYDAEVSGGRMTTPDGLDLTVQAWVEDGVPSGDTGGEDMPLVGIEIACEQPQRGSLHWLADGAASAIKGECFPEDMEPAVADIGGEQTSPALVRACLRRLLIPELVMSIHRVLDAEEMHELAQQLPEVVARMPRTHPLPRPPVDERDPRREELLSIDRSIAWAELKSHCLARVFTEPELRDFLQMAAVTEIKVIEMGGQAQVAGRLQPLQQ